MTHQLDFVEDFPQIVPDPPQAHVQFSVKWKCVNTGDEESPEAGVRVDLAGTDGGLLVTSIGRNVVALLPGETDEDTVGVGAVGTGSGLLTVTIDGANGVSAVIPITVS
ncbi:hypothetical protein [Nocardia sp. NBC_01009]|uniref:hypothetical protein n=1 Tax=Nocardia sp. NBC_01009 TaxID=2975996 RepID=UPI0038678FAE|nr:hypothetical protein OHA42_33975 [Nocardia sp. NBC_01009]